MKTQVSYLVIEDCSLRTVNELLLLGNVYLVSKKGTIYDMISEVL